MWNWQKMSCFWMNIVMLHPKIHYIFNCWESGLLNWWKFPTVIFNFSRLLPRNFKYGFRLCWMDTRLCQTIYGMWYVWWPRISGINAHHILFFHNKNCDNFVYVSIMFSCFLVCLAICPSCILKVSNFDRTNLLQLEEQVWREIK